MTVDITEASGRLYQNPTTKREIWLNIGCKAAGSQRYPDYNPALSQHISQEMHEQLVKALKEAFKDPPECSSGEGICAMLLCGITFGVCFCPLYRVKKRVGAFTEDLNERVAMLGEKHGVETRCELVKEGEREEDGGESWLDAHGHQLMAGTRPAGPPAGYNIVFTLAEDVAWPLSSK